MKKPLLLIAMTLFSVVAFAQTNVQIAGNLPNGTNTGFEYKFQTDNANDGGTLNCALSGGALGTTYTWGNVFGGTVPTGYDANGYAVKYDLNSEKFVIQTDGSNNGANFLRTRFPYANCNGYDGSPGYALDLSANRNIQVSITSDKSVTFKIFLCVLNGGGFYDFVDGASGDLATPISLVAGEKRIFTVTNPTHRSSDGADMAPYLNKVIGFAINVNEYVQAKLTVDFIRFGASTVPAENCTGCASTLTKPLYVDKYTNDYGAPTAAYWGTGNTNYNVKHIAGSGTTTLTTTATLPTYSALSMIPYTNPDMLTIGQQYTGNGNQLTALNMSTIGNDTVYVIAKASTGTPKLRIDIKDGNSYVSNDNTTNSEVTLSTSNKLYKFYYPNPKYTGGGTCTLGPCDVDKTTIKEFLLYVNADNGNYAGTITIDQFQVGGTPPSVTPTVGPSAPSITNVMANSFTVNWTNGDGTNRLVVVGTASGFTPTDATAYTANANYASGQDVSGGSTNIYAVYNGTGNSVNVTGLTAGTNYYVNIFEFNKVPFIDYLTTPFINTTQQTLASEPTSAATALSFTTVTSNSFTINWSNGNGSKRYVVLKEASAVDADPTDAVESTANATFGNGALLGTGNYVVYAGSGNSVTVTGLATSTTYHAAVYEYNGTNTTVNVLTSPKLIGNQTTAAAPIVEPTVAASGINFTSVTSSSFTINWVNGNGSKRFVVLKQGSNVDSDPVDGTESTANAAFGSGAQLGTGNFVVYAGSGNSVAVTGLTASTTYYAEIYEYNGTGSAVDVLTTSTITGNQATPAVATTEPTTAASGITFTSVTSTSMTVNWTNGNGSNRVVVVKQGGAIDFDPADANGYTADAAFTSGSQLGTGNYVVFNGSGNSVTITGLTAGMTYNVEVYEYNGSGSTANYLTSSTLTGSQSTTATPTAVLSANAYITSEVIYPNPSSEMVSMEVSFKTSSDVKVTLSDMMGKELMTIAEGNFTELHKSFDVSRLNKGIYTINFSVNGSLKSEMLMVK